MNGQNPETLIEAVRHFTDLSACHDYMVSLKWPDGKIVCPKCGSDQVGAITSRRLLQCKAKGCRKQFSAKVGTIFEDSSLGLDKWFVAVWCVSHGGVTSQALANALGVTQKSAWSMLDRIRAAMRTYSFAAADSSVQFLPAPGWEGYRVGSDGSVWSCRATGCARALSEHWTRIEGTIHVKGYRYVTLSHPDKKSVSRKVASLVLTAFVGPRPENKQCRHLDGNSLNDRLDNLCWGTALENGADKRRHGTIARGIRQEIKLTDRVVSEILAAKGKESALLVAARYGVSKDYVNQLWARGA